MIDPLSTQFTEVQRETHQGVIGQQEYDRRTYEVLYGTGDERPASKRRWAAVVVAAMAVLIVTAAVVWGVAAF